MSLAKFTERYYYIKLYCIIFIFIVIIFSPFSPIPHPFPLYLFFYLRATMKVGQLVLILRYFLPNHICHVGLKLYIDIGFIILEPVDIELIISSPGTYYDVIVIKSSLVGKNGKNKWTLSMVYIVYMYMVDDLVWIPRVIICMYLTIFFVLIFFLI